MLVILTGQTPQGTRINPGTGINALIARYNFFCIKPASELDDIDASDTMIISAFPSNMSVFKIVSMSDTLKET